MNKIVQIIKKVKRMFYKAFKNADGLYIPSEGGNLAQTFSVPTLIKISEKANKKIKKGRILR